VLRRCLLVLLAVLALPATADAKTPIPEVTGPLPVSAESYPFGAADHQLVPQDLARSGYVEEEYLVSGTANVYTWPAPGPAQVRTPDAPYTTRVLVRRPAKRSRFSGNVVVEMLNPSNLFDLNIGWALSHDQFMRDGDVWVGITAKPIAVAALKAFDPGRYGTLSFANPLPLSDPRNCTDIQTVVDPPELRSRATEDGLIWDINSQVGAWLRSGDGSNPLTYGSRRSRVERAYGFGYSQTGGYLVDYINAIHPRVVASDGKPLYDGYIVGVAGGAFVGAVPINQCEAAPPTDDPRRQIRDVGVPVIRIMSQSDYLLGIASRRPDGDTRADRFRHYEMAGAGHATPDELYYSAAPADIVKAGRPIPPERCNEGPRSRFPSRIHFDAVFRNLDLWTRFGLAPPHADPITVENGAPVLDEFGNVTGGLRSPYVDVPTSTWLGSSTGASFCFIAGHEVPLDAATLARLYPTHGAYVRAVTRDVVRLVARRFLTPIDGIRLIREAAAADVP
jgi:Alpha/beta hydrolase domain